MKHAAITALLCAVASAAPVEARTVFLGTLQVTDAPGCADWHTGDRQDARYEPSGLPGNGASTGLSLFGRGSALNLQKSGRFSNVLTAVAGNAITGSARDIIPAPKVAVTFSNPSGTGITAQSDFLSIKGKIQNPDDTNLQACTISFRASFIRR
jgi:hypothetical protein